MAFYCHIESAAVDGVYPSVGSKLKVKFDVHDARNFDFEISSLTVDLFSIEGSARRLTQDEVQEIDLEQVELLVLAEIRKGDYY